jgi:hypothetical protein
VGRQIVEHHNVARREGGRQEPVRRRHGRPDRSSVR